MDFNSMLIGTGQQGRDGRVLHEAARRADVHRRELRRLADRLGLGQRSAPHSEVHGRNASPGRLIWNIETTDVQGDSIA